MKVHPIIRQIVNRCHVGETDLTVIRYVVSRLKHKHRTFAAMPKKDRREFMRQVIRVHGENRKLYQHVMRGS